MKKVKINNFEISNSNPFCLIAGPCLIESRDHTMKMAELIYEICQETRINFIFKSSFDKANRSSIESSRGVGIKEAVTIFKKMEKVIFLSKKQLMKLNHKERQDYLSTQKRYNKFQIPLMTGMIKHIENAHEFSSFQHKFDEDYLIETYEEIINTNYSKIKKKEKN